MEGYKMAKAKTDFTKNVKKAAEQIEEVTQLPGQMELRQDGTLYTPRLKRKTYSDAEIQDAQEALKTQGRKGMKSPRVNLAFKPSVYDYVRTMSKVRNQNMTEFINEILADSMDKNKENYERAKAFINDFKLNI
jgi:hypothetical protein